MSTKTNSMINFFKRNKEMEQKGFNEENFVITDEMRREMAEAKEAQKWEQRRYETARMAALQDRRSVVLGKLHCSSEAIARNAVKLADALVAELKRKEGER